MTTPAPTDTDRSTLRDDLAGLKRDAAGLIDHLKTGVADGTRTAATEIDDGARRAMRSVADGAERSAGLIERKIEERPLVALLIALGVGWVGARLMSR